MNKDIQATYKTNPTLTDPQDNVLILSNTNNQVILSSQVNLGPDFTFYLTPDLAQQLYHELFTLYQQVFHTTSLTPPESDKDDYEEVFNPQTNQFYYLFLDRYLRSLTFHRPKEGKPFLYSFNQPRLSAFLYYLDKLLD